MVSRRKKRHIARLFVMFAGIICISALLLLPAKKADAYDTITGIQITVGYFGDTEPYEKAYVTLSELKENIGTEREIYTLINNGVKPTTVEAEGIYISDLMDYIDLDMDTVDGYNFFTQDAGYSERTRSWTNQELFGARYTVKSVFFRAIEDYEQDHEDYIRNWQAHYTVDNFFDKTNETYTPEAWSTREQVEPMLALRANSAKWSNYVPASALNFSSLYTSGTPILYFGQKSANEKAAFEMAQMIYEINVRYKGSPEISVETVDIEGEAGTQGAVIVHVTTPDAALTEGILKDLQYESSDTSVASVDKSGVVTIQGEGVANISVSYRGTVYGSVSASGQGKSEEDPEPDPKDDETPDPDEPETPDEPGKGNGEGSGEGDEGSGGGKGDTSGSGENEGNSGSGSSASGNGPSGTGGSTGLDQSGLSGTESGGTSSGKATAITEGVSGHTAVVPSGGVASGQNTQQTALAAEREGAAGDTGGGESDNIIPKEQKVYEIMPEQEALAVTALSPSDQKKLIRSALLFGLVTLIIGVFAESWYFRNQTLWAKRAKRIYEKR